MYSGGISEESVQAAPCVNDTIPSKTPKGLQSGGSKYGEEKCEIKQIPDGVSHYWLNATPPEGLQVEEGLGLDAPATLQSMGEDIVEIRSGSGDQERIEELYDLGVTTYEEFQSTGDVRNTDKAIESWEMAFGLSSSLHLDGLYLLNNLGCAHDSRFDHLGELSDINKSIESKAQVVLLASDSDPYKPVYLNTLGVSYDSRFGRLDELSDLDKAIESKAGAVSLTPNDDPDKAVYLNNLGMSYDARFERLGELSDLNNAITFKEQAASLIPEGDPGMPICLSNLGVSYQLRFERLGDLSDLKHAIEFTTQAISLTPDDCPDKPARLSNLGNSYETRFGRLGELSDLNNAIDYKAQAISLSPDGHPNEPVYLNNLGVSYETRFRHLGEFSDLNNAIESNFRAVSLTPDVHPDKPGRLNNLGVSYGARFGCLGELPYLNRAIESQAQAVSLTPDDHPDKPMYLDSLGNSYEIRFGRTGELFDLNNAIESKMQAVSLTPDGHPDKPARLNNLGVSSMTRFKRLGELSDLDNATDFQAQAVSLTPNGHPSKPRYLNNLGNLYEIRFRRLGEISDLDNAIDSQAQAVSLTPDDHPDSSGFLNNLGMSYDTRFEYLGEIPDLNKAIGSKARAVSLTPDGHPDKPMYVNNLGASYGVRFWRLGEPSDLNKAIEFHAQAVSLSPDGHPERPGYLKNLGDSYKVRFERLGELSDVHSAVLYFKRAAQSSTGPPPVRFRACRHWASLSSFDVASSPHPAYDHAMQLLPQLVWVGTTLERRYELVIEVGDFAAEAASHAISVGAYDLALEWLEAGRSIVWGQIAKLRTPFDQLAAHDPELPDQLRQVGCKLEQAGSRLSLMPGVGDDDRNLVSEVNSHVGLALTWDNLLAKARSLPGFGGFLRSPNSSQLLSAAKDGPIVVITIHQSRCDALLLQPNNTAISHLSLAMFSHEIATSVREDLVSLVGQRRFKKTGAKSGSNTDKPSLLQESLRNLWLGIVKPVLDHLGFINRPPKNALPHITWCTTGLLSFLPLHAAACYNQPGSNTFDHVISSYTPTLSALLSNQSRPATTPCGVVAVGQEHTPGFSSLPYINHELKAIEHHTCTSGYQQLKGSQATIDRVLGAMNQFSWVHMACHGTQNTTDPTQSAFHLHDGPLTLATITKQSFTNKGLAFLSACQTATGDENMPDEAMHLAAGMLMAGYPSVIGTMWSIADEDGPEVADRVYAELLGNGKMDHTRVAWALHQAVAELRTKVGEKNIARWAPFIHIGS